jgi:hypothetical protein
MNGTPYIPPSTRRELATPAPIGQRHEQIKKIVIPLIANGLSPNAVFAQVRGMHDPTITDKEIADVIRWASGKGFTPCLPLARDRQAVTPKPATKIIDFAANIRAFLNGDNTNEPDLYDVSPCRPLEDYKVDSVMFLATMFHGGEMVNIITKYGIDKSGRVYPFGFGLTLERDAMMRHIREHGTPQGKAGAWIRSNPIDGKPLPNAKGWQDANVTAYRFILLEIDEAPLDLQLSFFSKLPLPINAIFSSGGKSIHSLVRVNAKTAEGYRAQVDELFSLLKPFGVCQGNKNPSRLTRLVGAQREIGAQGDGQQRLLYLAPDRRNSIPIFDANQ